MQLFQVPVLVIYYISISIARHLHNIVETGSGLIGVQSFLVLNPMCRHFESVDGGLRCHVT